MDPKFTDYFISSVLVRRFEFESNYREIAEYIITNHVKSEVQENGRVRFWGYINGLEEAIRVVTLQDRRTVHNMFIDENFLG